MPFRPCAVILLTLGALLGCAATSSSSVLQGQPACAGDLCAPERDDLRAGFALFEHLKIETDKVRSCLRQVSNRSGLFGPDVARLQRLFDGMEAARAEGVARLRRRDLAGAWGRLNGLWVELPVLTLQLNYLITASRAEDAGVVTTHWMDLLGDLNRRTTPLLQSLEGWDTERISRAASSHRDDLVELRENLPRFEEAFTRGARWTQNGVHVANGITALLSTYALLGALRNPPPGPDITVRFPGLVAAGGVVGSGGMVVISAELLESIRTLIRIGAISTAVVGTNLAMMTGTPEIISGGTASITPDSEAPKNAEEGLSDLARLRGELGLAQGEGTVARLDVGGRRFYGINAHGQQVSLKVNAITRTHAEADAFQQAANAGVRGERGVLHVDRALCLACGPNGGVTGLARQLGLKELQIITPQGTQVIRP